MDRDGHIDRIVPVRPIARSHWTSVDLMPLASNLLTSRAFAAQLTQLIQARLGEGGGGFALFSGRA